MKIPRKSFGHLADGRQVDLFTLKNNNGLEIQITNFGGIITKILMPDKVGKVEDIVLGFDTLEEYIFNPPYFGCITGRVAGRIKNAQFELDGKVYLLSSNQGQHHLHGGFKGFNSKLWDVVHSENNLLVLKYCSIDGEEGYPGNLELEVNYRLTNENELHIEYRATTDKATPVNLTNHSYFNLSGKADVLDHRIQIEADHYLETDIELIPTGRCLPVAFTAYDFQREKSIGEDIKTTNGGYDDTFVLEQSDGRLQFIAQATDPESGRSLEVLTTEPGLVFYSGNFLENCHGKNGKIYQKHSGFCFEMQHFPDTPNRPEFPTVILRPGEQYQQHTMFRFLVKD